MTRILHVVGDSKYGGASVLIQRLAAEAQWRGYDASVLTTNPTFQEQLRAAGLRVVALDCIWRPVSAGRDLAGLVRLTRYLSEERYDIVHTHTSKGGFVGRLAARLAGVPVVIHTAHGFAFHEASSRRAFLIYCLLERVAAHFCDALVTVSQFHCDWAARLRIGDARKRLAIPNGIAPNRVRPARGRAAARAELGLGRTEIMCLTTGRLAEQKGLDVLLKALARVKATEPLRAFLAGDGDQREALQRLARDLGVDRKVVFLGFRTDLGDLLAAADMVVLPSLREGLSISLLEAMAAGKAVVATDIGSNLEVVRNGEAARVVRAGSADELAAAIVSLAGDDAARGQLGRKALAIFQAHYREDIMLGRYLALYAELMDAKRRRTAS
jgi:glycosyltransferase involved in cell wall biosynthesis